MTNSFILLFVLLLAVIIFLCVFSGGEEIASLVVGGLSRMKNIKENPQSKFETHVRDIFGNIAKTTLSISTALSSTKPSEGTSTRGMPLTKPKRNDYKFYTMYPDWLRWKVPGTNKVKQLEIDGYNELLGLAFEVQGPLHTVFDKKIDKTYANYYNRLLNDAAKIELAKEYGVGLIIVDYKVPRYLLSDYIKSRIYDLCQNAPPRLRCDLLVPISNNIPANYIPLIVNEPFRDPEAEKML